MVSQVFRVCQWAEGDGEIFREGFPEKVTSHQIYEEWAKVSHASTGKFRDGRDRKPTDRKREASKVIAVRGRGMDETLNDVIENRRRRVWKKNKWSWRVMWLGTATQKTKQTNKNLMQWLRRTSMCMDQEPSRVLKAKMSCDWVCILENCPQVPWKPEVNVQFSKEDNEPGNTGRRCLLGSLSSVGFTEICLISIL